MAIVKDWEIVASKQEGKCYRVAITERFTDDVEGTVTYGKTYQEVYYEGIDTKKSLKAKFQAKIDADKAKDSDEDLVQTDLQASLGTLK